MMRNRPGILAVLAAASLSIALAAPLARAAGGVYKWVDDQGVVHYDDRNTAGQRMTRQNIARGPVAADATATVPADEVAAVARQCAALRERSQVYANATVIYARDPGGNRYALSPAQLALERSRLSRETQRYCRPLAAQQLRTEARAAPAATAGGR